MNVTIGLATCILLVAAEGKDTKKDDPLAGSWKVSSLVAGGNDVAQFKGTIYTFKDGMLTMKGARGERKSTYKIDASKKPATLDMTAKGGMRDGMTTQAIFEVKDDELKICTAFMGGDRPKEFSGSEQGMALITLKRDSAAKADTKTDKP
jgi:uncharacterized protein (TIGR03067 family)